MRFLKILGMVVALHVVLFTVFLLSPGCQSNPTPTAQSPTSPEPEVSTSSLATTPIDEQENWSNQPSSVSNTISSAPLPGTSYGDSSRSTPSRPDRPETYVSTGDTPPTALNPPPTEHVVRSGDNLGKIAAKYGTTVAALQRVNPGIKPQSMRPGQKIKLPAGITAGQTSGTDSPSFASQGGATYTVRSGDSLSAIAARNGTTVTALRQANNLKGDTIQVGEELVIPGGAVSSQATQRVVGNSAMEFSSPGRISADASTTTFKHKLKSGETLGALSKRYSVSVPELMAANNVTDPTKIRAGQELVIPGYRGTPGAATSSPAASQTPRPAAPATTAPAPAPATSQPPATEPPPETEPLLPADLEDAPPIPVDEPTPTP